MKNLYLFFATPIFIGSILLNIFVFERAGSFANYVFLYGLSGRFFLNFELTLFAFFCCIAEILCILLIIKFYKLDTVNHTLIVSIYMNVITLTALFLMAVFPSVHFS